MTIGFLGNGFFAWYFMTYVAFIPALSVVSLPLLLVGKYTGWVKESTWRKYLLICGGMNVFWFWVTFLVLRKSLSGVDYFNLLNVDGEYFYWHLCAFVGQLGVAIQDIFFVAWLVHYFRKKELSNRFYKAWGWCFALLYFLPNVIYLTLVTVSFIQRN